METDKIKPKFRPGGRVVPKRPGNAGGGMEPIVGFPCLGVKMIGKPSAGKLHAGFDEGGLTAVYGQP